MQHFKSGTKRPYTPSLYKYIVYKSNLYSIDGSL